MILCASFVSVGYVMFFSCTVVSTTTSFSCALSPCSLRRDFENALHPGFADALAEIHQVARITGQLTTETQLIPQKYCQ